MKDRAFGWAAITAGLGYFLILLVFPVCEPTAGKAMKCFWSARAEMGGGAAIVAGGLLYLWSGHTQRRLALSQMIGVLAVLGLLWPSVLIGVCGHEAMLCRAATRPAWMVVSGLLLVASVVNAGLLAKRAGSVPPESADA